MTDAHLFGPQTLYRHWEDEQWNPFTIDLAADAAQWGDLSGDDRGLIFWVLSSLMVAEDRITTKSPASSAPTAAKRKRPFGHPAGR